jgi:exopolysaccharide production protein ExoZ
MLVNIQLLRALAAYLVVMVHSADVLSRSFTTGWANFGNFGVDLFFVISGFIMVYTTGKITVSPGVFFEDRLIRIVPLYWTITFLVFAVATVVPMLLQATRDDPVELLKSLLFIHFKKSNGLTQPIVFVGWTLNYEMFFYFLFAVSLFIRNRKIGLGLLIAILIGISVAGSILHPSGVVARFYTNSIMEEFMFGALIGAFHLKISSFAFFRYSRAVILIGAVSALYLFGSSFHIPRCIEFGLPAALIVVGCLNFEAQGLVLRSKFIQLLGAASYSIYLTHFFVTQLFVKINHHFNSPGLTIIFTVAAFVAVTFVGVLIHVFLEKPAGRWLKTRFHKSPTKLR